MATIGESIPVINRAIDRHIRKYGVEKVLTRGEASQDILAQMRNLTEHVIMLFSPEGKALELGENYLNDLVKNQKGQANEGDLETLSKFHKHRQSAASHYALNEEKSEFLMDCYIETLYKMRDIAREKFQCKVLNNLRDFLLPIDLDMKEFYDRIFEKIQEKGSDEGKMSQRYYVQKTKRFDESGTLFYEVTLSPANDEADKFNRLIMFTRHKLNENYAVRLRVVSDVVEVWGKTMPIHTITDWQVDIRPCEYQNFMAIVEDHPAELPAVERDVISQYLTTYPHSRLSDWLDCSEEELEEIQEAVNAPTFFETFAICRNIVKSEQPGANVLRYFLCCLNNRVLTAQLRKKSNEELSGLHLGKQSIPFDNMPYFYSLASHNPSMADINHCIPNGGREHERLAREVKDYTEATRKQKVDVNALSGFDDIPALVDRFNRMLYEGHREKSCLVLEDESIYLKSYNEDAATVLQELNRFSSGGISRYKKMVKSWEKSKGEDAKEKDGMNGVRDWMFKNSRIAVVTGCAGTGKSTLANDAAEILGEKNKLLVAATHSAVDNLRQRVNAPNCIFSTIQGVSANTTCDLLIVDECSYVSDRDMKTLLSKVTFQCVLLLGDPAQLPSIQFGTWFDELCNTCIENQKKKKTEETTEGATGGTKSEPSAGYLS